MHSTDTDMLTSKLSQARGTVKPRLHDTTCCHTGCHTGCTTSLTTGCIV